MINLPKITDLDVSGKRVLVRLDLDCEPDPNDLRIKASEETLNYLKEKNSQIIILAHRGRPTGDRDRDRDLSLGPFQKIFDKWGAKVEENLRFDPGEEANDPKFVRKLASLGDIYHGVASSAYVNEAFGNSHREHASIVSLPKLLPHAAGLRFEKEIENLSRVFDNPKRPVIFIVGGSKKDKLDCIEDLKNIADKILIGGRLPDYLRDTGYSLPVRQAGILDTKILVANLLPDKEDINPNSMEKFEIEIEKAGTIVLAGPMGKYEDEGHGQGTERIFKAVANSPAFKIAGGGDTVKILQALSAVEGFDWISVGGGAMLEFLAKRTLPGIKALESANLNMEGW